MPICGPDRTPIDSQHTATEIDVALYLLMQRTELVSVVNVPDARTGLAPFPGRFGRTNLKRPFFHPNVINLNQTPQRTPPIMNLAAPPQSPPRLPPPQIPRQASTIQCRCNPNTDARER